MDDRQRREFHEALLEADRLQDLPGKWQAAILEAEPNRPELRLVPDALVLCQLVRSRTRCPLGKKRWGFPRPSGVLLVLPLPNRLSAGRGVDVRLLVSLESLAPDLEARPCQDGQHSPAYHRGGGE